MAQQLCKKQPYDSSMENELKSQINSKSAATTTTIKSDKMASTTSLTKNSSTTTSSSSSKSTSTKMSYSMRTSSVTKSIDETTSIATNQMKIDNDKKMLLLTNNDAVDDHTTTAVKKSKKKSADSLTSINSLSRKKKSKKSKKSDSEKENISVKKLYLPNQQEMQINEKNRIRKVENFKPKNNNAIKINRYVSVKHLCRSFGDLTNFTNDSKGTKFSSNLKRAKSVGDMLERYQNRTIQTGVSVKALKSSFSKFDALQKKNILHVRSSDLGRAQENSNEETNDLEKKCRACGKVVYKMEEMKAERNIWHRNCFRCIECSKPLSVDTYLSHESVLYCKLHFRQLFAPKAVEDNEPVKPRKAEMIIRENEPLELPPDVVRASDKPDLGLEELHQLNVKSRFQVFENYQENAIEEQTAKNLDRSASGVKRSSTILSKLAKFQAKGTETGVNGATDSSDENGGMDSNEDDDIDDDNEDADLIRAKRAQRERPMSFNNMNDIKTKFESGHLMTREERREERKIEIQNIRSRLFMGKQAKIKEMYQQAVADSEQGITSTGKKPEIDIGDKARSLKEKFEKGEIFNRNKDEDNDQKLQDEDMVFEQGISKKSRSIFMELDASQQHPHALLPGTPKTPDTKKHSQPFLSITDDIIKCDDKSDDIKIETSEISSKFKFFETYRPAEKEKKQFRITPPRDGVVKMSTPEREIYVDPGVVRSEEKIDDPSVAEKTHTATKMLSIFRQMEETERHGEQDIGLKPLKRFTPPPENNRRVYNDDGNEEDEEEEEDDEEEEDSDEEEEEEEEEDNSVGGRPITRYEDEFLKQAQSAARAKQLRAKFEKWEANEIRREMNGNNNSSSVNLYERCDENEEGQVESAKSLRAKFESLRDTNNSQSRPRVQVNRFV